MTNKVQTFFTSDTHFGHKNIIKHCERPFKSVQEMDDTMIENWNNVVGPDDIVYHLGDFALGRGSYMQNVLDICSVLNGKKILIYGNHDYPKRLRLMTPFEEMHHVLFRRFGDLEIFMSHYAHRVWNKSHRGSIHLYAHSHGTLEEIGFSKDVGVDSNNFTPLSLKSIEEWYERKKIADGEDYK